MKNNITISLFAFFISISSFSQNGSNIEIAKKKFIEEHLSLTTEQSSAFWPIFSEFTKKRKEHKKLIFNLLEESNAMVATEEQLKTVMTRYYELKEKEIELEKEYYIKMAKVINSRQIITLIKTEKKFSKMLVQKLEEHHQNDK